MPAPEIPFRYLSAIDVVVRDRISGLRAQLGYTLVIIDDDPTGNQTVYDIPLLMDWSVDRLHSLLATNPPAFFILANTRSLPEAAAIARVAKIARNLKAANRRWRRKLLIISRSDSTLRGHFPAEIEALKPLRDWRKSCVLLAPAMFEGGRLTWDDTQYVQEGERLIPVSQTPYAKDPSFGYQHAHLPSWVEEKSRGRWSAARVRSLPPQQTSTLEQQFPILAMLRPGEVCVINAAHYGDMDQAAMLIWLWISSQKAPPIIIRSSSSLIPSLLGLRPKPLLTANKLGINTSKAGLVVVGSFVPKSTQQLAKLREGMPDAAAVELDPTHLLGEEAPQYVAQLTTQVQRSLASGSLTILFTARKLVQTDNPDTQLSLGQKVSDALVQLVQSLETAPAFLVAKGGITSHVLATEALGMQQGKVRGQILPGIPVWEMGSETRFPGLPYVVFPGNVGDDEALLTTCHTLMNPS